MNEIINKDFVGERPLFGSVDVYVEKCTFRDGESPLKESRNVSVRNCSFEWKYPLWYCKNVDVCDTVLLEMARAGIWYTENVSFSDCTIHAPKSFRRCRGVRLKNITLPNAAETLWNCKNVSLENVSARGDYFFMNSENISVNGLELNGNYSFDGAKNVEIRSSRLISKDAFWNSENVTVYNSFISGEYLGWNSKNLTLINCTVESLQGMCYIDNLKMVNCKTKDTTLAFEYSTVDVEIAGKIDSILNPAGGIIRVSEIGELTMESDKIDPSKTEITVASGINANI